MSSLVAGHPPDKWVTGIVEDGGGKRKQWPVTKFIYPGSHDACTWGHGVFDSNWRAQSETLYDQMAKYGQRFFDIRLALESDGALWPHHDIIHQTADRWADPQGNVTDQTLLGAIKSFANQNLGEIIILSIDLQEAPVQGVSFALLSKGVMQHIGNRLLAPGAVVRPTYQEAISAGRNIILAIDKARVDQSAQLAQFIWDRKDPKLFLDSGDHPIYDDDIWQSYKVGNILTAIKSFINAKSADVQKYQQFWRADFQLTPAGISKIPKLPADWQQSKALMSPYYLALGRNSDGPLTFTTTGPPQPWPGSNYVITYWETFNQDIWQKNASCVIFDFAGNGDNGYVKSFTDAIAYMNFLRD